MAPTITQGTTNFFTEEKYVSVGLPQVFYDAIIALRKALLAKLVAYGDVYFCKVEDAVTILHSGWAYRAIYVNSIQVDQFTQTKHHPTGGPRDQYDAFWMTVKYTEHHEIITPDGTTKIEDRTKGTPLLDQIIQLDAALAAHLKIGVPVGGHVGTGDTVPIGGHLPFLPVWPEVEILTPDDGILAALEEQFQKDWAKFAGKSHDTAKL